MHADLKEAARRKVQQVVAFVVPCKFCRPACDTVTVSVECMIVIRARFRGLDCKLTLVSAPTVALGKVDLMSPRPSTDAPHRYQSVASAIETADMPD